jgi:hypothetical protein
MFLPVPNPPARFALVIRSEPLKPGEPPIEIRLRRFLKLALRAFGLRCESITPAAPENPAQNTETPKEQNAQ